MPPSGKSATVCPMLSSAFLYSGHSPARPLELQAGPLTLRFEPDTACLRHIRLGDHEVVRALYAAVRHQDWSTIPPRVTLTRQDIGKDSFRLAFDVHCARGPVNYSWQGEVIGDPSGRIQFKFDGVANSDFLRTASASASCIRSRNVAVKNSRSRTPTARSSKGRSPITSRRISLFSISAPSRMTS